MSINPTDYILAHLRLEPVPSLPAVSLYTAHPGSRLSRLQGLDDAAPYWAWPWAGGLALAHHIMAHPQAVAGQRVLDLGAGSGLVGILAALAGATVSAAEIDQSGQAAIILNAAVNQVEITLVDIDIAGPAPTGFDLILAGDIFYNPDVAVDMLPFLTRCVGSGIAVLIGDPGRRDLPQARLEPLASYPVADVGDAHGSADRVGTVFALKWP